MYLIIIYLNHFLYFLKAENLFNHLGVVNMNDDIIYNGLTSSAYTDYKFWLEEGKTIFSDSWVFVGYKHELNSIGDVLPIKIAEQPIFLVKNIK